jgi:hypothetical protein
MGVEGRDGDGIGDRGDELEEMLSKETAMQSIRTLSEEVFGW